MIFAQTIALCAPPGRQSNSQGIENRLLFRLRPRRLAHVQGAPVGALERRGPALAPAENPFERRPSRTSDWPVAALGQAPTDYLDELVAPTAWDGGEIFTEVYPAALGMSLVEACRLKG